MYSKNEDLKWMRQALDIAETSARKGEIPVGAILIREGILLAASGNATLQQCDPTAHAEMLVLRQAAIQSNSPYLHDTTLYVTLEPCLMCLGAIIRLQIQRVIFGAYDPKRGAAGSALDILQLPSIDWRPDVIGGVLDQKSCQLLRNFFEQQRRKIHSS